MNEVGAYDDIDMAGIDPRFYANVPADAQKRLIGAIPECRLVWNAGAAKFQVCYREPAIANRLEDLWLRGWQIVATFGPPLDVEQIIAMLRKREQFVAWKLRKMGYGGETDREVIDAYLDDADNVLKKASDDLHEAVCDDYFHGPLARVRDEDAIYRKSLERALDETRRHTSRRRLVVPATHVPRFVTPKGGAA